MGKIARAKSATLVSLTAILIIAIFNFHYFYTPSSSSRLIFNFRHFKLRHSERSEESIAV